MNTEQRIINIEKMLRELVREKRKETTQWITAEQAYKLTGYSLETLRYKRRHGEIKRWRSVKGRRIQYDKAELEEMFTEVNKKISN